MGHFDSIDGKRDMYGMEILVRSRYVVLEQESKTTTASFA